MFAILLTLCGIIPHEFVAADSFSVAHHNRHHADDGSLLVDQVWWESWDSDAKRHKIEAWRSVNGDLLPWYDHGRCCWTAIWFDGQTLRIVRTKAFTESWTQGVDPELEDRKRYHDYRLERRGLRR